MAKFQLPVKPILAQNADQVNFDCTVRVDHSIVLHITGITSEANQEKVVRWLGGILRQHAHELGIMHVSAHIIPPAGKKHAQG